MSDQRAACGEMRRHGMDAIATGPGKAIFRPASWVVFRPYPTIIAQLVQTIEQIGAV